MLIANAKLFTMEGRDYDCGSVLIEGHRIVKVAPFIDDCENADGVIIQAEGCWVMPGLIDAHCHIGISAEKMGMAGDDCNEPNQPIVPYLQAVDAINPMDAAFHSAIQAGITSVMVGPGSANVVGGQFAFIKTDGRNIHHMTVLAPAAMKIALGENPKKNYASQNRMPASRMAIGAMLREALYEATRYTQTKKEATSAQESFEPDFRMESWIPVIQRKIPIKAHAHRADDILTAIRLAKEFNVNLTLDHCTEGHLIADDIKASGFPAIIGPNFASRNKVEIQYMDTKTAGVLHKAGVKIAIMSDHPVSLIQYLPIYAGILARDGLGIEEGLKAITINAAQICNVSHRVGSLCAGKDADIAIFDGNPMNTFTKCLYTIINGKVAYAFDG